MTSVELATFIDYVLIEPVSKCATTQEVEGRLCEACDADISHKRPQAKFCSRACAHSATNNFARDMEAEMLRELKTVTRNVAYGYLNRDRYIGMDGRYEGPMNKSVTFVESIVKDKGYHPMPIDVHVRAIEPKFTQVTPEDVDWGNRQGRKGHTPMHRKHNNFCAVCVQVVIDKDKRQVRTTKGVYLPIEHQCNSVRVYDLRGKLLETKTL